MAQTMNDSPYAMSLPRPYDQVQNGLGYSRHYAQRIRDMGKDSKDTWIKKLWTHMFQGKNKERVKFRERDTSRDGLTRSRSRLYPMSPGRDSSQSIHSHKYANKEYGATEKHSENGIKSVSKRRRGEQIHRNNSSDDLYSTPNLPPINSKSPNMVTLSNETVKAQRSAPAIQSVYKQKNVRTLYDTDNEYETDEEKQEKPQSPTAQRPSKSNSQKRMSFFDRMAMSSRHAQRTESTETVAKSTSDTYKSERSKQNPPPPMIKFTSATRSSDDNKSAVPSSTELTKSQSEPRSGRSKDSSTELRSAAHRQGATVDKRSSRETRAPTYPSGKLERKLRKLHNTYDGNKYLRPEQHKKSHPFFGSHAFLAERAAEEKRPKREPLSLELDKRAKTIADKAIKV